MKLNGIRTFMQWVAFSGSNLYLGCFKTRQIYQGSLKSTCVPFLNCHSCPSALFSCPVGVCQHFVTIHKIPLLLMGYLASVGILFGSMACGWLCPFGFTQDLMYRIKSTKIRIPKQLYALRYFSLLFLVILIPVVTHETWFCKLCPMGTLQAALPWVVWNPTIPVYNELAVNTSALGFLFTVKILLLISFLVLFVVSKRPFCRLVCPLGAVFGFFNKYSLVRIKVDKKDCNGCHKCAAGCPVDLEVCDDPDASTCVRCFKCTECENVKINIGGLQEKVGFLK